MSWRIRLPELTVAKFEDGKIKDEPDTGGIIALYNLMSGKMKSPSDLMIADKCREKLKILNNSNGKAKYDDLILTDDEYDLMKGLIAPDGNYDAALTITTALAVYVKAFKYPTELDDKGRLVKSEPEE